MSFFIIIQCTPGNTHDIEQTVLSHEARGGVDSSPCCDIRQQGQYHIAEADLCL